MAEVSKQKKVLTRTSTVQQINQYMQDAELGAEDELDLITFIVAAQAIKPGAKQDELMGIFEEADDVDDADLASKIHTLLKRVSVIDGDTLPKMDANKTSLQFVPEGSVSDSEEDEEETMVKKATGPKGHTRRRSVYQQAEIDATERMAKTTQKLDIAAEMLKQGITPSVVASVTGLDPKTLNGILGSAHLNEPEEHQQLNTSQVADLVRLCQQGPAQVAEEAELAHGLLVALKDSLLASATSNTAMFSLASNFHQMVSMDSDMPMRKQEAGEDDLPGALGGSESIHQMSQAPQESVSQVYELEFKQKPLGMSWNQTSDGKNLYVQDVSQGGLGQQLGVKVGSVIQSFNGMDVYDQGPEKIYQKFKSCTLPIIIGFRNPVASDANDPKVLMLKEVTGLETVTVIKLLHKFNGNVQAANEAFYIAKARTKQWIAKQKTDPNAASPPVEPETPEPSNPEKKKRHWWKSWTKTVKGK